MLTQNPTYTQSYQPTQIQTQLTQFSINQHKCKMKSHYPIIYKNTKLQKVKLQIFHKCKCRRITTDDYESIPHGWIINTIKQTIDGIHRHRS